MTAPGARPAAFRPFIHGKAPLVSPACRPGGPRQDTSMKNRCRGMTMIELMTAMLILAILMGLAVPSFRQFAADSRAQAASSDLTTALATARSEAVKRSTRVIACSTSNGITCANSTNWSTGWLTFVDLNGNNLVDGGLNGPELIHVWPALQGNLVAGATANRAVYNSQGMAQLPVGAVSVTFTITPTGCVGKRIRETRMALSGSLQTRPVDCP
jgi:type IV fimbrial biogenesis protein FimT